MWGHFLCHNRNMREHTMQSDLSIFVVGKHWLCCDVDSWLLSLHLSKMKLWVDKTWYKCVEFNAKYAVRHAFGHKVIQQKNVVGMQVLTPFLHRVFKWKTIPLLFRFTYIWSNTPWKNIHAERARRIFVVLEFDLKFMNHCSKSIPARYVHTCAYEYAFREILKQTTVLDHQR